MNRKIPVDITGKPMTYRQERLTAKNYKSKPHNGYMLIKEAFIRAGIIKE